MSMRQVLTTLTAALNDSNAGLAASAAMIASADSITDYITGVNLEPWALSGNMKTSTQNNVAVSPRGWDADLQKQAGEIRDARTQFQVAFESFAADPSVTQDTVSVFASALMQVLDSLREYSDANEGTVILVEEPVSFTFGPFTGGSQSAGFIANAVIRERGYE